MMENIEIIKFENFEVDLNKTKSLFDSLERIICLFNKINFKNYKIGGSLAFALKEKKLYRTPGDIDIVIENEFDLRYIIDFLLTQGFGFSENFEPACIDEFEFKRTFLERERFAEKKRNEHFFESLYAPCYTSYLGNKFAEDFSNLDKIPYYLLHDPKRKNYFNISDNFLTINFRYKNTIQDTEDKNKKDLVTKLNLNNYTSIFGFLYYTIDGEEPNGRYGKPLNPSTKVVNCKLDRSDGFGGCFYSSEKIDKNIYLKNFKYKIGIYKNCATLHLFDPKNKSKIGFLLSKDKGDVAKYKNVQIPIISIDGFFTNKYFRKKDLTDFKALNLPFYLKKTFWKNKNQKEIDEYLKNIYSLIEEKEEDMDFDKILALSKHHMSYFSRAFYRHPGDL